MIGSYSTTRRSLHGLAELVPAGPRYVAGGSMPLRADHEGITTWDDPLFRLSHGRLERDHARVDVAGMTFAAAAAVGPSAQTLDHVYDDGPHVAPDERVVLDVTEFAHAEALVRFFQEGAWEADR